MGDSYPPLPEEYPGELMPEYIEVPTIQEVENCTDLGNARRFSRIYKDVVRYVSDRGQWVHWNGKCWESVTADGVIMRLAKKIPENIYFEGCRKGGDVGDKLKAFSLKSESSKSLKAMIELAKSEPELVIDGEDLDRDPFLLNVQNGTIDLRTGRLRTHDRADLITKIAPVDMPVDNQGDCPVFKRFLGDIFRNDKDLIEFMQRMLGYFLTGSTCEQKFFYFYGTGANGKSTLLIIPSWLLGPYAKTVPSEIFMASDNNGGATPVLAQLPGVRLVSSNEVGEGRRMDEPLVKSLTGGDIITARQLYKPPFEFLPAFKPVMAGNHKPEIRGTDTGIWRRMVLVPFNVSIPPEKQDRRLSDKLKAELPEILRWTVQGCLKWQREGLSIPAAVEAATNEYRSDMDIIGNWLNQCCVLGAEHEAQSTKLYESYREWATDNGFRAVSQRKLSNSLKERGFQSVKRSSSCWLGLGLNNDYSTASREY